MNYFNSKVIGCTLAYYGNFLCPRLYQFGYSYLDFTILIMMHKQKEKKRSVESRIERTVGPTFRYLGVRDFGVFEHLMHKKK
jgi:hypothetical protein